MGDQEVPTNVTFVELAALWKIANRDLVSVTNSYWEQAAEAKKLTGYSDMDEYGRVIQWWSYMAHQLQEALNTSAITVGTTARVLDSIVDMYTHTDGANAQHLNEAGKEMENALDGEKALKEIQPDDYSLGASPDVKDWDSEEMDELQDEAEKKTEEDVRNSKEEEVDD